MVNGQSVKVNTEAKQLKIGTRTADGYVALMDFPIKDVKKEFWRFCRRKAKYQNMREYYRMTIPPMGKEENAPLVLLITFEDKAGKTLIGSLLEADNMTKQEAATYADLPKNILREFQIYHHKKWLQEMISDLEKKSKRLAKKEKKLINKVSKYKAKESPRIDNKRINQLEKERNDITLDIQIKLQEIKKMLRLYNEIR